MISQVGCTCCFCFQAIKGCTVTHPLQQSHIDKIIKQQRENRCGIAIGRAFKRVQPLPHHSSCAGFHVEGFRIRWWQRSCVGCDASARVAEAALDLPRSKVVAHHIFGRRLTPLPQIVDLFAQLRLCENEGGIVCLHRHPIDT